MQEPSHLLPPPQRGGGESGGAAHRRRPRLLPLETAFLKIDLRVYTVKFLTNRKPLSCLKQAEKGRRTQTAILRTRYYQRIKQIRPLHPSLMTRSSVSWSFMRASTGILNSLLCSPSLTSS